MEPSAPVMWATLEGGRGFDWGYWRERWVGVYLPWEIKSHGDEGR